MAVRFNPLPKKKKPAPTARRTAKRAVQGRIGRVAFAMLVAAAVLALTFFLVLRTTNQVSIAENAVGTLLSPIQRAFSSATIFVRDTVTGVKDYFYITEELAKTKQKLTDAQIQLMEYREAAQENDRLKSLLKSSERYGQLDPIYARVINKNPSVYFSTFSINVGTNDGVKVNMAVINGDGLVGRVYEVGATYAKVMTLANADSTVACIVERTRNEGLMYGPVDPDADVLQCQMRFLPQVNEISSGDAVITAGQDGIYPKGLPVGTVTSVSRQQTGESDRSILVQPIVDFLRIEEVLVLRVNVATDEDQRSVPLPTPSPRPTPEATVAPAATPIPDDTTSGLEDEFHLPVGTVDAEGNPIEDATSAAQQPQSADNGGNSFIEDEWAR